MAKSKEIKFKTFFFGEISTDGVINHEYRWDKELEILSHFIDGVKIEELTLNDAKIRLNEIIGNKKKSGRKVTHQETPTVIDKDVTVIYDTQLKLF